MPDINMQVFEEIQRNPLVTVVDIQTQNALDDYQVELSDIANPTQSHDNVVIDRFGEFLPHWNESLDFNTWVKMSMETAGKRLLMLSGNSNVSSASNGIVTFDFFDDFETGEETYSASRVTGSSIGFNAATPRVVVADNGTWLMVYRAKSDGNPPTGHEGQVWIRNSTDDGETWSTGTKLSADAYDAINAEFVKYPNGDIDIFYTRYDNATSTAYLPVMVSRSVDDGSNWGAFATAPTPWNTYRQVHWQEIIIGSITYVATYGSGTCDLYKTTDNGANWTKISEIAGSNYSEPGLVYLGSNTFVCVMRDAGGAHTIQKRSTDSGETWITDGYIKSTGEVLPTIGAGTNVALHQCRLWKKDINENNLGYVYMQAALYPGGFPRDMYAYFSTDHCASWGSKSAIYTASDCHDSAFVLKSSSSAKYYPGKISGESNTTDDDITISAETSPLGTKWDVTNTDVSVSTEQAFQGTRSAKFSVSGSLTKTLVHSDNIAIKFWTYFPSQPDTMYPFLHGDGVSRTYVAAGYPTAGDISYHDGAWKNTGVNTITGTWVSFEARDFKWASHTQDILYNENVIAADVGQRASSSNDDTFRIASDGSEYYIDCVIVRKYTAFPPIWAADGEQNIAVALKSLGRAG